MESLIREVMHWHADPDSSDYNECDKEHCHWCANAAAVLKEVEETEATQFIQCGRFALDNATGKDRLSCACGRAVVRQPWMSKETWETAQVLFRIEHIPNFEAVKFALKKRFPSKDKKEIKRIGVGARVRLRSGYHKDSRPTTVKAENETSVILAAPREGYEAWNKCDVEAIP